MSWGRTMRTRAIELQLGIVGAVMVLMPAIAGGQTRPSFPLLWLSTRPERSPAAQPTTRPTTTAPATRPAAAPATAPSRLPYTAPGTAFRGTGTALGTAALIQVGALTPAVTGGRELSETQAARPFAARTGTLGFSAPTSGFSGATVTTPGILTGALGGLGFAAANNLLTARTNPASGPGGGCTQVANGGFRTGPAICGLQRR